MSGHWQPVRDHGHDHDRDPYPYPGPGPGHDLSRGRRLRREAANEAVSDVVAPVRLFHHHRQELQRRESVMTVAVAVMLMLLHETDERNEGPCWSGHRTGSLVKNGFSVPQRHFESVEGVLEMAHGEMTCDGAHVALVEEGVSPVSVGQHLGCANLSANSVVNLSVSLSVNRHHGHGETSEGLAEAEERAPRMEAGLDADCCGMASHLHLHLHSLATARDGCRAGICGRRRDNRREMEVGGSFRIWGDEKTKDPEVRNREARLDGNTSG